MADRIKKMKPRRTGDTYSVRTLVVAGCIAVICVTLVLGIVFAVGGSSGKQGKGIEAQTAPGTSSTTPAGTTVAPSGQTDASQVEAPPLSIYRRRNPFKPLVNMEASSTGTGAGVVTVPPGLDGGASNVGDVVSRSITLEGTSEQDGRLFARIRVGDQLYDRVAVGDTFGDSYKLLSMGKDSNATILYGDERFTVYVGQSIYW
jgi:hypothetical protein